MLQLSLSYLELNFQRWHRDCDAFLERLWLWAFAVCERVEKIAEILGNRFEDRDWTLPLVPILGVMFANVLHGYFIQCKI